MKFEGISRVRIATTALLCVLAVPQVLAQKTDNSLQKEIKALQDADLRGKPLPEVRAEIEALLQKAKGHTEIPQSDVFLLRKAWLSTYFYEGDAPKAMSLIEALLKDIEASPEKGGAAHMEVLGNYASLLNLTGRGRDALAQMKTVQAYFASHGGKQTENYVASTAEIGAIQFALGEPVEAEASSAEAVELARKIKVDDPTLIRYWQNWAAILNKVGRTGDGIRELQAVSRYSEEKVGPDHPLTANALRNLGVELSNAGRYQEAIAVLRRAIEPTRKNDETQSESYLPFVLNSMASALLGAEGPTAALPVYESAIAAVRKKPNPSTPHLPGELMLNLAQTQETLGNHAEALKIRHDALEEMQKVLGDSHSTVGRAQSEYGISLIQSGDYKGALPHLNAASRIYARSASPRDRRRLLNSVMEGFARFKTGDSAGYEEASAAVAVAREAMMTDMTSPTQTIKNATQYSAIFNDFAHLAMTANRPADAFEAMQLAQSGDIDSAGAAYLARTAGQDAAISKTLRDVQDKGNQLAKLRGQRAGLVAEQKATEVAALDAQVATLEGEVDRLQRDIDKALPAYSKIIRPEPLTLASVQAKLHGNDALLVSQTARVGVLTMLVSAKETHFAMVPAKRGQVDKLVGRMRNSIDEALESDANDAGFDVAAASQLHSLVMPAAIDKHAARAGTLFVRGGGVLSNIPFAALVAGKAPATSTQQKALRDVPWLIKRQAVVTPASLALLGNEKSAQSEVRFAGIGAPTLGGAGNANLQVAMRGLKRAGAIDASNVAELPDLPGAAAELADMKKAIGGGDALLLTGGLATRSAVMSADLSKYNVIAFATHGLVSGELRGLTEPGLVLTPVKGQADSGVLTASDVAMLKLDADWVILSACNTGAGDSPGAPMYSGLARAFVFAGARGLLLSHWPVRDDVASRLTVATVKYAKQGLSRGAALRKVQTELMADRTVPAGAHPATWAPYVLMGN